MSRPRTSALGTALSLLGTVETGSGQLPEPKFQNDSCQGPAGAEAGRPGPPTDPLIPNPLRTTHPDLFHADLHGYGDLGGVFHVLARVHTQALIAKAVLAQQYLRLIGALLRHHAQRPLARTARDPGYRPTSRDAYVCDALIAAQAAVLAVSQSLRSR